MSSIPRISLPACTGAPTSSIWNGGLRKRRPD
jgi:hypothetical protein